MPKNKNIKYLTLVSLILLIVLFLFDIRSFSESKYFSSNGDEFFPNETTEKKDFDLKIKIIKINPNLGNVLLQFELVSNKKTDSKKNYELLLSSGELEKNNEIIKLNSKSVFRAKKVLLEKFDNNSNVSTYYSKPINIRIDKNWNSHWFPFDSYNVNLNIDLLKNEYGIIHPKFIVLIEENILLNGTPTKVKFKNMDEINELSCKVHFKRPMFLQFSFFLILTILLLIMLWSIKYLKSENDSNNYEVLALAATIFISVPSLKSFLIPYNLEYAPFFDFFSTIIFLFALLAIITFIIRNKQFKKPN